MEKGVDLYRFRSKNVRKVVSNSDLGSWGYKSNSGDDFKLKALWSSNDVDWTAIDSVGEIWWNASDVGS